MTDLERQLDHLVEALGQQPVRGSAHEKFQHYRSLVNQRLPFPVEEDFLQKEGQLLAQWRRDQVVASLADCQPTAYPQIYLWQGDLTLLAVDAIVNAANSVMLGCFEPCHDCLDNQIHTFAGVGLRLSCAAIKQERGGKPLAVGQAVLTPAYHLPASWVIHTVGPAIRRLPVSDMMQHLLKQAYRSSLAVADQAGLETIALPCLSTGEFHFPDDLACLLAVEAVRDYLTQTKSQMKIIFVVWTDQQYHYYHEQLMRGGDSSLCGNPKT